MKQRPWLHVGCSAWLEIVSSIVPAAVRRDWLAEWNAELSWHFAEPRAAARAIGPPWQDDFRLAGRCLGALPHALWMRKEEWSPDMLIQDVRYALRQLLARPAFTALAVLTLALGIGANTAIFSVVHGVLLKPLPYEAPGRLVQLWETNPLRNWSEATIAPANLLDWRQQNQVFQDIAMYMGSDTREAGASGYTLSEGAEAEHLEGLLVGTNFFDVLGVQPILGRDFTDQESTTGHHRVMILSHELWKRRFGADPAVINSSVRLGPRQYHVAGVMPAGFRFGTAVDFWAPLTYDPAVYRTMRRPHFLRAVARLRDGVTLDEARADLSAIASSLERQYPETNTKMGVGVGPLDDWFVGNIRTALLVFLGAVACLLLIVCANVANLMLSRAIGRAHEIAIRSALGAGRLRLARQFLSESALLAAAGAALGAIVAAWGVRGIVALSPPGIPRLEDVGVDSSVLLFTTAITAVTALLFGLVPALHVTRTDAAGALSSTARSGAARGRLARRSLVVAEVALAFVLVVGAGLMVRSFVRLQNVHPGFDPSNLLTARVSVGGQYDDDEKVRAFFERVLDEVRSEPGIQAAGASNAIPLGGYVWTGDLSVEGRPEVWGRELRHKRVTAGYLEALGLPLLAGRTISAADRDGKPVVVVVNQTLAREFFPGVDPVGQRISFSRPHEEPDWVTIAGVVGDEKQDGLDAKVRPEVYESHLQSVSRTMTLVVRTTARPESALAPVRRAVAKVDAGVAVYDIRTMGDRMAEATTHQKLNMWIFGFFGFSALALAAIGVAGVVSFAVTSRVREIGVRAALGASSRQILQLVVLDGIRLALLGLGLGLALASVLTRSLSSLLFETAATDGATYGVVGVFLLAVAVVAAYLPARAALRVDPIRVLRVDN